MKTIILYGFIISLTTLISCGRTVDGVSGGLRGDAAPISLEYLIQATELARKNSVYVLVDQFNNPQPPNPLIDLTELEIKSIPYDPGFKNWTGGVTFNPDDSSATVTATTQKYFSNYQFSDNEDLFKSYPESSFVITKMDKIISLLCSISHVHALADFPFESGYPKDGYYRTVVTAQVQNQVNKACGYSNALKLGTYDYLVESVDGTSFDKKITFMQPYNNHYWYFGIDTNRFNVAVQSPLSRILYFENKNVNTVSFEWIKINDPNLSKTGYLERVFLDNSNKYAQIVVNDSKNDLRFTLSVLTGADKKSQLSIANNNMGDIILNVCLDSNQTPPMQVGTYPPSIAYSNCLSGANLDVVPATTVINLYKKLNDLDPVLNWNCVNENSTQEFEKDQVFVPAFINTNLCI